MGYEISLTGKTAIITGSNSGIGLGVAWSLAKAGADVVLNSFSDNKEDHALASRIARKTVSKRVTFRPTCLTEINAVC